MTDLERLKETFSILGIVYEIGNNEDYECTLTIEEGKGYGGFFCAFYFDKGQFTGYAVLE